MDLHPDVLRMLALELDLPSIIKFCKSNKLVKKSVCENNMFWRNKLYKDFPYALTDIPVGANYEKIYKTVRKSYWSYYYVYPFPAKRGEIPKMANILGKSYSDFPEEMRKAEQVLIQGIYPKGTNVWVYYADNILFGNGSAGAAGSKEKAIEGIIKYAKYVINPDSYWQKGFIDKRPFEQHYGVTEQELKNCLDKTLACQITNSKGNYGDFVIREFTIP